MAAGALQRAKAGGVRAHGAGGRLRRRQHPHHRAAGGWRVHDQRLQAVHHQCGHGHNGLRDDHRADRSIGFQREISNIIVPNGTPGYEIGEPYRKMGWNASDTRPLSFEDCRVPESNLLGKRGGGFRQFMHTLEGGRIGVAALGVGLAQGALDEAIAYAKERRTWGKPISSYQAIQGRSRTSPPRSRPPGCSPTGPRCRRIAASRSGSRPLRQS